MQIVLSFDDGRSDAYQAYLILKKYGLLGSFHITTGFIDGSFITNRFGVDRKPININQILEMNNEKMDISSHGDRHILDDKDFKKSISKIEEWGVHKNIYGFSIPNSNYTNEELKKFIEYNKNKLGYIRVGRNPKCYKRFSKLCYALYHVLRWQVFYNLFNKHNLLESIDKYQIYSLVIKRDIKSKNVIKFIDKYNNAGNTLVIMFHSIVDRPSNKWEWSTSYFETLCKYLSEEKKKSIIKVLTLEQLTKDL